MSIALPATASVRMVHTPFGDWYLAVDNGAIVALTAKPLPLTEEREDDVPLLDEAEGQLRDYFTGVRRDFSLPLRPAGTAFQKTVWEALQSIPYGETRTYGEVAAVIGRPGAARAVGCGCHHNPILVFIPCHRVVGQNGSLIGFAAGIDTKRQLLALEGKGA